MDVGGTKMEGPREFLQEAPVQSVGGPTATSASAGINLPPDNGRSVAVETTANPLTYWPPPASALPTMNSCKEGADVPPSETSRPDAVDSSNASRQPVEERTAGEKGGEGGLSSGSPSQTPKILHHNLPPIAGITSSHNYRGAKEIQKHSANSAEEKKSAPETHPEGGERESCPVPEEAKTVSTEQSDCEIVEVPTERPKTANSDHVFSIPTAVNPGTHPKTAASPRAPTPFVLSPSPATETLTLNVNSCPGMPAGCPSPSARNTPSHMTTPSPTPATSTSPSESLRLLSSHSGLPSPSNVHQRVLSSNPKTPGTGEAPRMLSSPHPAGSPQVNPPSPSQRTASLPYVPNSHSSHPYLNTPRNHFGGSPVQNFNPDSGRPGSAHGAFKETARMNAPQTSLPSTTPDLSQRISQPADSHTCRNPFELPMTKSSYAPQYHQEHHHHHHHHHPNNARHPMDPHPKFEQYVNLPTSVRDQHRRPPPGPGFYPPGFGAARINEKDCERQSDASYKPPVTSQPLPKDAYPVDSSQAEGSMRAANPLRGFPEAIGSKMDGSNVSAWNKPDGSEMAYLNAQANKNFNRVNGNEYSKGGYHDPLKQGMHHPPEGFSRFGASNGEKQNGPLGQMNSLSQRFPPVPQSNYDLNRHIYDSMRGGSRSAQPQMGRSLDKNPPQFPSRDPNVSTTNSYHRDFSEGDKGKSYGTPVQVKGNEYSGQGRSPYGQHNNSGEKTAQDVCLNKRPCGQTGFPPQGQPNESRHSLSGPLDPHKGFASRTNAGHHHLVQQTCPPNLTADRSRVVQNQSTFPQKPQQHSAEYDAKPRGTAAQFAGTQTPQPMIPLLQPRRRCPSSTTVPVRAKRESPLDLSVKTVRQSADSTAKDDGEAYLQNFRNFLHPPHQPPRSESRYPVSQSTEASAGAPKIDFTPNFSGFHSESQGPSAPLHHKSDVSALPPVESFKKFPARMPTTTTTAAAATMVQDPKVRPGFNPPKYFSPPPMTNQKPQSSDQALARYPDHFKTEVQKRAADDPLRSHVPQAKIPRIDPWKLAFDQQIEQRLNSARMSHQNAQNAERATNGVDAAKSSGVASHHPSNFPRHSGNHYRGANMYPQPPVQTSAAPYNPSYVQQPQCQPATPQTPQEKLQHRENVGHSPDPEQIIKQISKGVMPDHKLLQDKNVLSILRSSLEEKEAKLMQLREVAKRKEKYRELMTCDLARKQFQGQPQGKPNLPPFGALALERMCAPPSFPGHRLHLPRPVDTVKIDVEPTRKYFGSPGKNEAEKSGIPSADLSPHDDAQGPPTDLDGLAAFLAARIRTKGELKQVDPALDPGRPGLPPHGKIHSVPHSSANESAERGLPAGNALPATNFPPSGSPPKLIRESRLLPPLRRRLFSHTEEEAPTTSGTHPDEHPSLPPRDPNGIRSSSETSVFDFRESDSEGEMPVLERQTLEGMRRDRRTFGSKQNVSTTTPDEAVDSDKPEVIAELDKSHPDPFWDTAFDMFVEQLEKRPPKRSVRKKKVCSRLPFAGSEAEQSDQPNAGETVAEDEDEEGEEETKVQETEDALSHKIKTEPDEGNEVESVPDGHVKLSSSRLKEYRDEMMKEDGSRVAKAEGEEKKEEGKEKATKDAEKPKGGLPKKGEGGKEECGVKTRGRSRLREKETLLLDYESDSEGRDPRSDSDSTMEDDDDSLSLSGLESESSDSDSSQESSNSNFSSYDDSENETAAKKKMRMQTRLQTRSSRQRQVKGTGMKLRSKAAPLPKAAAKLTRKKKRRKEEYYSSGKKKKPSFGDGSDFRPGWEEECYKFKQQLRMPEKLISISRPPKRSSVSLPDLDPYRNSPSLDSSDASVPKKSESRKAAAVESDESDPDATKKSKTEENFWPSDNNLSLLRSRNGKKSQSSSIINLLVNKYGKGNPKKQKELKAMNERKSPRILPKATNKPELLPTPGLGVGKENVLKDKKRSRESAKKKAEEGDSVYLGYFRRKTVNNFKDAFKQKVGLLPQEFSPVVLKSRTRTQTRDMKKRATLMEVFGEDRPASAPPLCREEDASTDQEKVDRPPEKKKPKAVKKTCGGVVTRGRGKLTRSGRPGLRSTAVLRSNKAVQISKRHLNAGRKRNMEILRMRAMASKKFSYLVGSSDVSGQLPITKKRLKLRSVRRKFRSGFDYIRKKKKMKKDGDSADGSVKEKRLPARPTSESVEDIQNEIKNWVINKGLGETILHRAARLGYTDVAAYCLEKMDCSPSPRDNAGYTPLHEACSRGHLDIAKLLLMYGASVSESAKGGIRPLHEAAENGFTELIRLLLSYGADPLLETYTGHTALSLVSDEEARRLIQHHLADVQGNVAPVWTFRGPASLFDPTESGCDPLCDPPSPPSVHSDCELEASEAMLPPLYRLAGDRDPERRWLLMRDLLSHTKAKSKDALLKHLPPTSLREMKLSEFHEQARTCNLLGLGDRPPTKASKIILVSYDDKVRHLLGVERILL